MNCALQTDDFGLCSSPILVAICVSSVDTADAIANDLLSAGLLDARNIIVGECGAKCIDVKLGTQSACIVGSSYCQAPNHPIHIKLPFYSLFSNLS